MSLWKKIRKKVTSYASGLLKPIDEFLGTDFSKVDDRDAQIDENNSARAFEANQAAIQRQFNASEAEKTREFNAQQAQLQRDWEASQSATAVQRRTADLKAAGINPVLAAGASADTGTGAMASATPATSGIAGAPTNGLPVSTARKMHRLEMLAMKAQIEKTKAEKNNVEAETKYTRTLNKNAGTRTTAMENDENFAKTWWGRNISPALRDVFGGGGGAVAAGATAGVATSKANSARKAATRPIVNIHKH